MSKYYKIVNIVSWFTLSIFVIVNLVFIMNSTVNIPYIFTFIATPIIVILLIKLYTRYKNKLTMI